MRGADWSKGEIEAVVEDYFAMLREQQRGVRPNKAAHRRELAERLTERSHKAIEYKHMNISAVLDEKGLPYVEGYRPMPHYQQALKDAVEEYLASHPRFRTR